MAKPQTKKTKKISMAETPAKDKSKGVELGSSGTNVFSGIVTEEYLPELSGMRAMRTYDEMRKSDATVKAALLAIQLPIRRAEWFVEPGIQDEKGKEQAEFIAKCLFDEMSITWDDFLRQALLSTAYGVMLFEKVFDIREMNGKTRIVLKKLAPRLPRTILTWQQSDGSDGINQTTQDGSNVNIPMDKLVIFVNEKEGDNWWGISVLRAAYKHWYIKKNLETIDAVAHERQGLGIPYVKIPAEASPEDRANAIAVLKNMRAHEEGYLLEPEGMEVNFKDMHTSGTKDAARAIDYHDRQITKAVLAQFLSLGSGPSGSRALSEDQTTLFLQSIEAVANGFKDCMNKYMIRQLVDLNFGKQEAYPKLNYAGISKADVDKLTTSYQRCVQTGGIKPQESDEVFLRKIMGLPDKEENEMGDTTEEDTQDVEDVESDLGIPDVTDKPVENSEIDSGIKKKLSHIPNQAQQIDFLESQIEKVGKMKHPAFREVVNVLSKNLSEIKRKVFQETNDFKSWRKLTFAERKVNFPSLQSFLNKNEDSFSAEATEVLKRAADEFSRKLTKYVNEDKKQEIKDLEMPYWSEYKSVVKSYLQESYSFGKNNASREMDVKAPANPQELSQTLDLMADNIATQHYFEIETQAKQSVANQLAKFGEKEIKALAAALAAIQASTEKLVRDTAAIILAATINQGRKLVFDRNANKIHALQRSEILDEVTCNFCLSMDGRVVELDDSITKEGTFHSHCRGIWVEILKDEEELPEITGIPNSLRDRLGDSVNEIVQPKTPIVRKDSLAAQLLKKKNKDSDVNASEKDIEKMKADNPHQCGKCGSHRQG